jgi:hypothetical protein
MIPDVSQQVGLFAKAQNYIMVKRAEFQGLQEDLRAQIAAYNTWRRSGIIHPGLVNSAGYPTNSLHADIRRADGTVAEVRGQEALDHMADLVTSQAGKDTYTSGVDGPLVGGSVPAPSASASK